MENSTEIVLLPACRKERGKYIERFEYSPSPRGDLIFQLVTTQTHNAIAFPEIVAVVNELLKERGNVLYPLALIEGARRGTTDARVIITEGIANRVEDPFFDPLSPEAFKIFRRSEKYKDGSMAEAAARYVGGWRAYMQKHGHFPTAMDKEFKKVFEPFKDSVPDYLKLVKPYLEKLRRELGEERYTSELIHDFQFLMDLVNHKTAKSIVNMTRQIKGEVFLYCGANHRAAVEEAVRTISTSGNPNR